MNPSANYYKQLGITWSDQVKMAEIAIRHEITYDVSIWMSSDELNQKMLRIKFLKNKLKRARWNVTRAKNLSQKGS